jgi:predicted xylose isomerase-like sugar epimerase
LPERTGLVHISGVVDAGVTVDAMLDARRALVDKDPRAHAAGEREAPSLSGDAKPRRTGVTP